METEAEIYLNLDNFQLPYSTRKAIVEKLSSYVKHKEKEAQKELLKYKIFYEHIEKHLTKDQKVICKICNKDLDEILKEVSNN